MRALDFLYYRWKIGGPSFGRLREERERDHRLASKAMCCMLVVGVIVMDVALTNGN